jgi:DNA modification methylase
VSLQPYFSDSAVTLYHGDCREILPTLAAVDHVITDPPYEAEAHTLQRRVQRGAERGTARTRSGMRVETLPFQAITEDERRFVSAEFGRLCKRWALVFCQAEAAHLWEASLLAGGLNRRRWCVWTKPDGQPQFSGDRPGMGYETIVACHAMGKSRWNGGGALGVFVYAKQSDRHLTPSGGGAPHPTTKPEPLMADLVGKFTDPDDVILDPFVGSGTTLVAAKRLGRKAIGIEINEQYAEVAARRLSQGALFSEASALTPLLPEAGRGRMFDDDPTDPRAGDQKEIA